MIDKTDLSRRHLFRTTSAAGVAGSMIGPAANVSQISTAVEGTAPQSTGTAASREADVVVIGSGAAGLPAAIVAREAGASVIVIEAEKHIGGHAITSGGNVPAGRWHQRAEEIRHRGFARSVCSMT